jgi:hypothetical protein
MDTKEGTAATDEGVRIPEFHTEVAKEAVKIALMEAAQGVFENDNDNRGPRVDEYQRVGGTLGQAWCAKFAYWCFMQASLKLGVANPFPRIFGAARLEEWGKKEDRMVTDPACGDVLIKEHHHVGLVTGPRLPGEIVPSVEGNTWEHVHKEGVYVLQKERFTKCTFIRL